MNKPKTISIFLILLFSFLFFDSCTNEDVPTLLTSEVLDVTAKTATCGGTIMSTSISDIIEYGVCWSTSPKPTIKGFRTIQTDSLFEYQSKLIGLLPNTKYFVRSYATSNEGTGYGNAISFSTEDGVIDVDGNVYNIVKIGNQVWMAENLRVTKFRDGTSIPNLNSVTKWIAGTAKAAYCNYANDTNRAKTYGRLYNWKVIDNVKNIAPDGWHVPSDLEWDTLSTFLGGDFVAGGKLKEKGTLHWQSPNDGATNESGFNALPGGFTWGYAFYMGSWGCWWTTSETVGYRVIFNYVPWLSSMPADQSINTGVSIRCVKDK